MPSLNKNPSKSGAKKFWRVTTVRYLVQGTIRATIAILPFTGLFRIDLSTGRFLLAGYQIWWSDFFLIFPFWLLLIAGAATVYSMLGMVFCGWACIQNTLSEFVDYLVIKILKSKKQSLGLDSLTIGADLSKSSKATPVGWVLFGTIIVLMSIALGVVFAGYFVAPKVLWNDIRTASNTHGVFFIIPGIGALFILDLFLIRHYWCNWVCPYPLWQHMFKSEATMKVAFDDARREECTGCNLCVKSCIVDIDPRDTKNYTRCINCGECVVACEDYSGKKNVPSLLTFHFDGFSIGKDGKKHINKVSPALNRFALTAGFTMIPLTLFIYGIFSYIPFHITFSQNPGQLTSYSLAISNKKPVPQSFLIQQDGLPSGSVRMGAGEVTIPAGGKKIIPFSILPKEGNLSEGLHPFVIHVTSLNSKKQELSQEASVYITQGL
jgi:polyferredoxin